MSAIKSLWIVGAGKMGQALYRGWVTTNVPIDAITLIDPAMQPADVLLRQPDRCLNQPPPTDDLKPDIVVLAVKPQAIHETLPQYKSHIRLDTLILSIVAGLACDTLANLCGNPHQPIIRLMPNTPAMIGQGMTAGVANDHVSDAQRDVARLLFEAVGTFIWLSNEQDLHAVTALSGSGPAYLFALIEAMMAAGVKQGLSSDIAELLARQTVIGSAALAAAQPDLSAETLRQNVTSPNGTTAAGLAVLQPDLQDLLKRTVAAAAKRSRELGA